MTSGTDGGGGGPSRGGGSPSRGGMRPVLLTVDDDVAVSRALARDLRRRYSESLRVVRADSGAQALEALRELTLRGDAVAVLVADHRMPGMTGVEFLERAMDLAPQAKRVLLTAYADTDVAIRAINEVDLDHYLLKPWDPPEERLYPVLDDLLEDWTAGATRDTAAVRVLGHRWSARGSELREFLTRHWVPHRWLDVDADPEGRRLLALTGHGPDDLPLLVTGEGEVLVRPDVHALADRLGVATSASRDFYDVLVVGGGPAGLGAAVYAASEGLRTLLVEKAAAGGQAGQSSRIENYLGFPTGISGDDLARRAADQARRFDTEMLLLHRVVGLEARGSARVLRLDDGSELAAHAVVVATGVMYNKLPAPGVHDFTGRGVYYGAATTEAKNCRDSEVYVVGGANSAGQAALHFARYARRVTLLVRGSDLRASMSHYLVERIEAAPDIEVRTCTVVAGATGADHLETLTLQSTATGATETVDANWLFVFIGAAPHTDWLDGVVARDDRGFVLTGPDLVSDGRPPDGWPLQRDPYHLEASVPGVFVAGDVRADSVKRVASAVGEGAMAISLVHRYLEKS